jgi:uncharacterized protein YneR
VERRLTMKIHLSDRAKQWFKDEMDVEKGDYIKFYVRYGGSSPLHDSFSLGVTKEEPITVGEKVEVDGITYFVEEKDLWFFDGHDLHVEFDETLDEPKYEYKK